MRTEGSLESRINNLCSIAGYTEDEMQKLGTKLLRIFRDVCRNNRLDADDIIEAGITNDRERAEELLMMLTDIVHTKVQNNDRDILLKHAKIYNKSKFRAAFRDVSWLR